MDLLWTGLFTIAGGILGSLATWLLSSKKLARDRTKREAARSADAQWVLERVNGEVWTLTRSSPLDAFGLHVWEPGDHVSAGHIRVAEYLRRGDLRSKESVRIDGVRPGAELVMDWVENGERLGATVVMRDGQTKVVLKRSDTTLPM